MSGNVVQIYAASIKQTACLQKERRQYPFPLTIWLLPSATFQAYFMLVFFNRIEWMPRPGIKHQPMLNLKLLQLYFPESVQVRVETLLPHCSVCPTWHFSWKLAYVLVELAFCSDYILGKMWPHSGKPKPDWNGIIWKRKAIFGSWISAILASRKTFLLLPASVSTRSMVTSKKILLWPATALFWILLWWLYYRI